jgi:hypothetical protein
MGEALRPGCHLDIEAELQLVEKVKTELTAAKSGSSEQYVKTTMKELGLKRSDKSKYVRPLILRTYMTLWTSACYSTCNSGTYVGKNHIAEF